MKLGGAISVLPNPVSTIEAPYTETFHPSLSTRDKGFVGLKKEDRADGGFYRAAFNLYGPTTFLKFFMAEALGKKIVISGSYGQPVWEGILYEMDINSPVASYRTTLANMYNRVWIKYRVTNTSTTVDSTPLENAASQKRFGVREYVMTGGEIKNSSVADQPVQRFLNQNSFPKKTPVSVGVNPQGQEGPGKSFISVKCRGFMDTLDWLVYNDTSIAQGTHHAANQLIQDVLDAAGQFVKSYSLAPNGTSLPAYLDMDRRAGGIIRDAARFGDSIYQRWVTYMTFGQHFVYEEAAPARWKAVL